MRANATSVPAPVGGLNDRDSLADMPAKDAVILNNWWPYPSEVAVRKGYSDWATGFSEPVETIVEYLPVSGTSTLFAISDGEIFDITTAGAIGAAVVTGLSNSRFQNVNITTPGGSFMYLLNGVDEPQLWNGATWVSVDGVSVPAITGVTTTELVHGTVFKNRIFFVQAASLNLWYLPVNSIGGLAVKIDLGSVFNLGGYIQAVYNWTIDAGDGSDDHLAVITSNGEVAVYKGTDPSSATTWALVGVFVLGRPLGRRCGIKYGGDLAINCMEGVFPMGKALLSASVDRRVSLTDKIQNSVSIAANTYGSNFGWQLCLFPSANMLILNVPSVDGANYQFAQNTLTGSWAKFTGWNASSWCNASSGLYFGDDDSVKFAWSGNLDGMSSIVADVLPAFSYFGLRAQNKYFTMVKPYLQSGGSPSVIYGLNIDFNPQDVTGALNYTPPTGMVWGSLVWGTMVWGGGLTNIANWQTVGAVGSSAALRLKVQNNGAPLTWSATDFVYQKGGVL